MSEPESVLGHQTVDLLPSERTIFKEILTVAQKRLRAKTARVEKPDEMIDALESWAVETQRRFREMGFVVHIDEYNLEADINDKPIFSPIVDFTGRVEDSDFDFDRASHEVQRGLADGVVGKIDVNGIWKDPDLTL